MKCSECCLIGMKILQNVKSVMQILIGLHLVNMRTKILRGEM